MNTNIRSILGFCALLLFTSCDNRMYRDGYSAGEKDGREAGERNGYRRGYYAGTLKVVGDDWLPSIGYGICGAIALIVGGITFSLLWDSTGRLIVGSQRLGVWVWEHVDTWQFRRNYALRIDTMRQRGRADAEARVRIQATHLLKQAHGTLTDEEIRLHVEHLLRTSQLVRDMQDNIEVSMAACETALDHIHHHPHLTAEQRGKLLRHLAEALPAAA